MDPVQPFDLYRIFLGTDDSWLYLIEIVFRTTVMFSWTLLNVRFLDKRNIGQLTPFEFLITFALGSATGDPMFYQEIPLFHGMVVISTVVALEKLLSHLIEKHDQIEEFVDGNPAVIIKHGKILQTELDRQNMSKQELFARLRQEGVDNVGAVQFAILETSGRLSVIRSKQPQQGESTVSLE